MNQEEDIDRVLGQIQKAIARGKESDQRLLANHKQIQANQKELLALQRRTVEALEKIAAALEKHLPEIYR